MAKSEGPPNGSLLIIGGTVTDVIRKAAFELSGGADAKWVVIPTARGYDNYDGFRDDNLGDVPCQSLTVLHTTNRDEANSEKFVQPLASATAVWFSGGRQFRLVNSYKDTRTERELRAVLTRGGLIAGSSAGATIQGSYLLRGAPSEESRILMYAAHEEAFGYISNAAIDQHVHQRARDFDVSYVVARYPNLLGIGLDEGAAAIVQRNILTVIGENRVLISDGAYHPIQPFYALVRGDRFDLATWTKTA